MVLKRLRHEFSACEILQLENAWMNTQLFHNWFHQDFVPYVKEKLRLLGKELRAVLILDNCSAHPEEEELVSEDGEIFALSSYHQMSFLLSNQWIKVFYSVSKNHTRKNCYIHLLLMTI